MYWVVLSCFSLAESWTWFILSWYTIIYIATRRTLATQLANNSTRLPFYAYIRLLVLSYLVLPQTQGARLLYQSHIHPFLAQHEAEIDNFIIHAHDQARAAGLQYLKRALDFIKESVFGVQPKAQHSPLAGNGGNYTQNLLSRFNLPSARQGLAAPAGDFYGLLSAALGQMGSSGGTRELQVEEMSNSGVLIPQGITSHAEKMTFLAMQRERLRMLLSVLDQEATNLSNDELIERDVNRRMGERMEVPGEEGLKKSRSEAEFDTIERDELSGEKSGQSSEGSWLPWTWGTKPAGALRESGKARSTGAETTP